MSLLNTSLALLGGPGLIVFGTIGLLVTRTRVDTKALERERRKKVQQIAGLLEAAPQPGAGPALYFGDPPVGDFGPGNGNDSQERQPAAPVTALEVLRPEDGRAPFGPEHYRNGLAKAEGADPALSRTDEIEPITRRSTKS